ncbi:LPS assembly lipoprotein LptE [Sandarakinorhabdus sp.]|uniref:LPS assembly lipoprotein LptE n=1 Tax=Sandarakinorhabdus sp. TaxID=1916663 RepID=UPI00286DC0B6|nr:LPS assembly lipoprotein LptE [Sandarakinorhabdus sp.]
MLTLSACALSPVYGGGGRSASARLLNDISVAPITDRAGFLVRESLKEQLGKPAANPRYRLEVLLDDKIVAFGVRGDSSAARERRTLRARFRLVEASTGTVVLDDTATADAGIDRVSSNYAVVAAEATALERLANDIARQITARLARHGNATAKKSTVSDSPR